MSALILENARWLGADGRFHEGTLAARDGRIVASAGDVEGERLDAAGLLVLPGAVDAHTHLREPGQEQKEGIERGTKAALAGGVTTVLDMPNNAPPIDSAELLDKKRKLFRGKSRVNWGLHVQAPFRGPLEPTGYAAAKVYLARSSSLPAVPTAALGEVFAAFARVAVHAEDEAAFVPASRFTGARTHHRQRPRSAVVAALERMEEALGALGPRRPRVTLCHLSTAEEVAWLRRVKSVGWDVWGETCPHYWRLTEDDYVREGPRLKVNPPLRTRADAEAILEALADGTIDFVATDHAPHTPAEKADEKNAPSGIPSIEWYLPLLLELVEEERIGWSRLPELTSRGAARCYGLEGREGIAPGARADLVLVARRPGAPKHPLITGAGYDPYAAVAFTWRVEATIVNGRVAWTDRDGLQEQVHAGEEVACR